MLMTFPSVRHIGDSLLASAGLAGLIVGFAAKPTLSSLIAGVQLAQVAVGAIVYLVVEAGSPAPALEGALPSTGGNWRGRILGGLPTRPLRGQGRQQLASHSGRVTNTLVER